jgi:predicted PurR-regulated permease PerM
MKNERLQIIFFFAIFIASIILMLTLAYPFIGAMVISLTLAISFRRLFRKFVKKFGGRRGLAATMTILIIIIVVIIPLSLIGTKVFQEISNVYLSYSADNINGGFLSQLPQTTNAWLAKYFPGVNLDLQVYIQRGAGWLFSNLNNIFSSALKMIFNLFIIFITLFYLFKDGHKLRQLILRFSPLGNQESMIVTNQLELTINSVVKGTIVIAVVQGLLAGVGFALFGISEPILWAILTTIASILPGLGTSLVFLPLVIYLAATGTYGSAIGLALWGLVIVGLVDNFLRPFLLERDIKIHPLLIFLSVLGGLSIFGALGFILGPLILSTTFSLSHIYQENKTK